jgi:putative redox protein
MAAGGARTPITVTHDGGVRFTAQVRGHRVVVDQLERSGGGDTGPTPIELLGVSLGTCVSLYVQQFCEARGLSSAGLRVEVVQHGAQNPNRIGEFAVRVELPDGIPTPYLPMLERVARSCPAHNTLAHGAEIRVEIAAAAVAESGVAG